jgi:hypothetical protein
MIQLAWRFLMFQKESALALWCRARTADSRRCAVCGGCVIRCTRSRYRPRQASDCPVPERRPQSVRIGVQLDPALIRI